VPYIPGIPGLEETERNRPGTVIHSKHFRGRDMYENKVSEQATSCGEWQC
jgi:cation diffusion facilitator CzcD-associated flavoprotein CzcO